ncbi:hypothetical protein D3C83_274160 [compost metagenome]
MQSGVRALDWREAIRVPLDADRQAIKLYVRLFDEIDGEFDGTVAAMPFLRVATDGDGALVLRADPAAEP